MASRGLVSRVATDKYEKTRWTQGSSVDLGKRMTKGRLPLLRNGTLTGWEMQRCCRDHRRIRRHGWTAGHSQIAPVSTGVIRFGVMEPTEVAWRYHSANSGLLL